MSEMGAIAALWRYPVKSMLGEELAKVGVALSSCFGIHFDIVAPYLVDLTTHLVVGLHFGGRYLQGNEAVALWTLRTDPLIKKAKIEFV